MRIQHNIMAMNAYRNYNLNTSAVSKNLEKLSSGYRINRAGDDAAGLAISEKMRAQITGLDAATKNVKDGISLVKTAEGAMQEVQDMLNRMVNLATQSANGTYDNEIDRANLQAEVDQLRSEINRIADSANFNGIKLLDGSLEGDTVETKLVYTGKQALTIVGDTTATGSTVNATAAASANTIVHKDGNAFSLTSFDVNLRKVSVSATTGTPEAVTLTVGGATVVLAGSKVSGTLSAESLAEALAKDNTSVTIGGVKYDITANGDKLTFTMNEDQARGIKTAASFSAPQDVSFAVGNNSQVDDRVEIGVINTHQGSPASGDVLASTTTAAVFAAVGNIGNLKDGAGITVGDTSYVFATTNKTANTSYGDNVKVVDLRDLVDPSTGLVRDDPDNIDAALSRLVEAAKDNEMFDVGVTDNGSLTFWEKKSYSGDAKLDTWQKLQNQIQTFSSVTATEEIVKKGAGKALTLQIGDTSDSFNQLKVSIGDIHTTALGINTINIGTQAGAQAAVNTIKNAINTVSSIRGTLGATQNRLEHTQNNLSVMKENIQDAESTIRDTDIAEEMMAYTKNNILVQSAQAMLAQANQIPQGVLQLLG